MKYSPSKKLFYPKNKLTKYKNLPSDLINVDRETFINAVNISDDKEITIKNNELVIVSKIHNDKTDTLNTLNTINTINTINTLNTITEQYIYDVISVKYNFRSIGDYVGYPNKFRKIAEALGKWKADVWTYTEKQIELIKNDKLKDLDINKYKEKLPVFKKPK